MLQRFPEGVKWHNDRRQRLLNLTRELFFTTLWITITMMIGAVFLRHVAAGTQTTWDWVFTLLIGTVIARKFIPASFNLWRMLLWTGRAIFRPRGTQTFQLVATSLAAFGWVSVVIAVAVKFAEPVLRFLESLGLSISV